MGAPSPQKKTARKATAKAAPRTPGLQERVAKLEAQILKLQTALAQVLGAVGAQQAQVKLQQQIQAAAMAELTGDPTSQSLDIIDKA
jgi:hypothetical protein